MRRSHILPKLKVLVGSKGDGGTKSPRKCASAMGVGGGSMRNGKGRDFSDGGVG